MLKLIDFKLYPLDIYIHIGDDINDSLNRFINLKTNLEYRGDWDTHDASVHYDIISKESNRFSIIIAFREIPRLIYIVHELIHATSRIYEHIGQAYTGDENHAYLSEFLANEIEIFIDEYKNNTNKTN